jgi:ADA HAT complex component 1
MFRFWQSESRATKEGLEAPLHKDLDIVTVDPSDDNMALPLKRRRGSDDTGDALTSAVPVKRVKVDDSASARPQVASTSPSVDELRALVNHEFSTEILLKHNEKRLIDQELAKCQIALEQLRRCHLVPYPVNCLTPDQMLATSNGTGPALQTRPNEPVPAWAPPFGVVDGPYARHYARWLIPHEKFDGSLPEWHLAADSSRARASFAEGRTTRNSFLEPVGGMKCRSGRGIPGPKLHALPSGRAQQKEKAGPCILKRADGQTVKLVCIDCNREDFSSTQGFINHCRIAHKRDYKSHEEAAVKSGQPYQPADVPVPAAGVTTGAGTGISPVTGEHQAATNPTPQPGSAHPLTSPGDSDVYATLLSRIQATQAMLRQQNLPGITEMPRDRSGTADGQVSRGKSDSDIKPATQTPWLSRLMLNHNIDCNLSDLVEDVTTKVSLDDVTPDEDSEDESAAETPQARAQVAMRVPAKSTKSPTSTFAAATRPTSSKGRLPPVAIPEQNRSAFDSSTDSTPVATSDEDVDMEEPSLSPNTLISNNAPSLVSDDGEYDDSDEGSSVSGQSEHLDGDAVSDIAEINLDDEHDHRALRRTSTSVPSAVRLQRDDLKHVSFVGPVNGGSRERRSRKA